MYWTKTIKNKVIEFQAGFEPVLPQLETSFHINEKIFDFAVNILNIFSFGISRTRKVDHAGVNIDIALFTFHFRMDWYDRRHWDWKNNKWIC